MIEKVLINMKIKNSMSFVLVMLAFAGFSQSNLDLCNREQALLKLGQIEKEAKEVVKNTRDDNCVLKFLDTLTVCFIETGETKYISALESICKISDGYVSEYFWELTEKIVHQNFTAYSDYLSKSDRCLEMYLLQIMTPKSRQDDLFQRIDKELGKEKISINKKEYLKKLKAKVSQQ